MISAPSSNNSIIGFFHAIELPWDASEDDTVIYEQKRAEFAAHLTALGNKLKSLNYLDYGKDLELILFQFQLFPSEETAENYKDVENYRPKEKSVVINIIVNDENFFFKPAKERQAFLHETILSRMDRLQQRLHKRLDTNFSKLITDLDQLVA